MHAATEYTYTFEDLQNWPSTCFGKRPADEIPLAVIGHPVAHSLSPVMHNAALAKLAELAELAKNDTELSNTKHNFAKWRYFKFDITRDELPTALGLFHQKKFLGLNLTVPHKMLVMEHLRLDNEDSFLKETGAANTLHYNNAWWDGYNTDVFGLARALHGALDTDVKGKPIVLLGAGGPHVPLL